MQLINFYHTDTLLTKSESAPGVPDIVNNLFPNLPMFIAHVLATIVIVIFLSRLVYKPFKKMIVERRKKINELLDDASGKQAIANKDKKDAEKLINIAKVESKEIVIKAKGEADILKMEIIENARKEAANIQNHAKKTIEFEKNEANEEIRKQIIDLAFEAANKIMDVNVSNDVNKKLIDEFLNGLGS